MAMRKFVDIHKQGDVVHFDWDFHSANSLSGPRIGDLSATEFLSSTSTTLTSPSGNLVEVHASLILHYAKQVFIVHLAPVSLPFQPLHSCSLCVSPSDFRSAV